MTPSSGRVDAQFLQIYHTFDRLKRCPTCETALSMPSFARTPSGRRADGHTHSTKTFPRRLIRRIRFGECRHICRCSCPHSALRPNAAGLGVPVGDANGGLFYLRGDTVARSTFCRQPLKPCGGQAGSCSRILRNRRVHARSLLCGFHWNGNSRPRCSGSRHWSRHQCLGSWRCSPCASSQFFDGTYRSGAGTTTGFSTWGDWRRSGPDLATGSSSGRFRLVRLPPGRGRGRQRIVARG